MTYEDQVVTYQALRGAGFVERGQYEMVLFLGMREIVFTKYDGLMQLYRFDGERARSIDTPREERLFADE